MVVVAILSAPWLRYRPTGYSARERHLPQHTRINGNPGGVHHWSNPALTPVLHLVIVSALITFTAPFVIWRTVTGELARFLARFLVR